MYAIDTARAVLETDPANAVDTAAVSSGGREETLLVGEGDREMCCRNCAVLPIVLGALERRYVPSNFAGTKADTGTLRN